MGRAKVLPNKLTRAARAAFTAVCSWSRDSASFALSSAKTATLDSASNTNATRSRGIKSLTSRFSKSSRVVFVKCVGCSQSSSDYAHCKILASTSLFACPEQTHKQLRFVSTQVECLHGHENHDPRGCKPRGACFSIRCFRNRNFRF